MQTKHAEIPIAAQLAAAILGTGLMAADQAHVGEVEQEAALMTQAMEELEARKMRQTTGALDKKYAAAEREVGYAVKIAAAFTAADGDAEKLAWLLEQPGMDKEAIGGLLGSVAQAGRSALKGIGGAVSAAGRLKPLAATAAAPAAAVAAAPAAAVATKSKPLLSMATKGKLLAGGAVVGTGYVGMKGLQGARDFMMAPGGHSHGAPIMNNVNEFGYPQY